MMQYVYIAFCDEIIFGHKQTYRKTERQLQLHFHKPVKLVETLNIKENLCSKDKHCSVINL